MPEPAHIAPTPYADIVDLDRYPLHHLDSVRGQAFLLACQQDLRTNGVCLLPGFLTAGAVARIIGQTADLAAKAWSTDKSHTVYFEPVDNSVPADDPRAAEQRSAKKAIAYDYIPDASPIRVLYESADLTTFVAAVLGKETLYRSADPLDALEIAMFEPGDELGWHFDRSEFSVTVMYQEAEQGGHFDYYPALRSADDENYPGVRNVLQGHEDGVVRLPSGPGALAIFRGQHALHRVTPVGGSRPRINSVLTYGERPDMKLNELAQLLFYGRTV